MPTAKKVIVKEIPQKRERFPPVREFDVTLHQPSSDWTGDDVLSLVLIPQKSDQHPRVNCTCTACFRKAVRRGPARWYVEIRYIASEE